MNNELSIGEKLELLIGRLASGRSSSVQGVGEVVSCVVDTTTLIVDGITYEVTRCVEMGAPFWTIRNINTGKTTEFDNEWGLPSYGTRTQHLQEFKQLIVD